jgi:hypothetical protein
MLPTERDANNLFPHLLQGAGIGVENSVKSVAKKAGGGPDRSATVKQIQWLRLSNRPIDPL